MSQITAETLADVVRQQSNLTDLRVQHAIANVPRHQFLPNIPHDMVYSDTSVPVCIDTDGEVVCSATMPSMIAFMLDQLDVRDGDNVLEIGTGTGYVAALLRDMVGPNGNVTSLEIDPQIANLARDNLLRATVTGVNVVTVDGAHGYAPRAAYDRIVSTVGVWDIPKAWINQLKPDGRIVAPVWLDGIQVTAAFRVQPDGSLYGENAKPSSFVYIRGVAAGPQVRKRVGSTALNIIADEVNKIDTAALHLLLSNDYEYSHLSTSLQSAEYWHGFLPYLMLHETDTEVFALYDVPSYGKAYGIEGEGFAVFCPASASFVPYYGIGNVHNYAGSEAFLHIEAHLMDWEAAGRPGIDRLRLRFVPKASGKPEMPYQTGKIYERRDHYLMVWLYDTETEHVH